LRRSRLYDRPDAVRGRRLDAGRCDGPADRLSFIMGAKAPLDHERENGMDVNGLSAVVTGGASGLGAATVRALAAKGAKVAIFDLNEEAGEAIAKEVGGVFCKVDVTSDESVDAGFAKARGANGQERI